MIGGGRSFFMSPDRSRRSFLRKLAGGAALLPVAARTLGELSPLLAATGGDEAYWHMVRYQFAFSEDKVPVNAGNLCPSPEAVAQRVTEVTRDIDIDCSFQNRDKFKETLEESRSKVAAQLGVSADEVALVRNTSEGNNTINNGLPLKAGDEVVLWDENHPTNNVAWDVRAARLGLSVKRVHLPQHPKSGAEIVDIFEKALTPQTRVLSITHVSSASGMRLPAKELTAMARGRGIYVHLDGAQSWGALHLNLREIGCDSYAASAHKWFTGPKEVGLLYVRQERIREIWPNVVAPGWGDDADPDVVGARKFESLGQRDDAALTAVGTTADFHNVLTPARVEARVMELAAELKAGLNDAGAKLVTPVEPELSGGICIIDVPEKNRHELLDRMYNEHGIAGSTSGGFRLCPHIYNTKEHIERAVRGVKELKSLIA
jgi:selenocysteine lyase/cysteine desulfurase